MAKGDQLSIGSDYTLTLPLKNDDESAMSLAAVEGITVALVQGKNKVVHRYSLHDISNGFEYGKLSILDAAAGTVKLVVEKSVSIKCTAGDLFYRAEVQSANADFTDNSSNTESAVGYIAEMIPSTTKRIDLAS